MRIAIVSQFYEPEPAGLQVDIARHLARAGHEVRVVTGFPNYPGGHVYPGYRIRPFLRERLAGVEVNRVALYPSHDASAFRRALNYVSFAAAFFVASPILLRGVDVIYVYHPPGTAAFAAALFGRVTRRPVVVHLQDMWPESVTSSGFVKTGAAERAIAGLLTWMCDRTYRWSSRLAVISPGFKALLIERGVDEAAIDVVPNWADERVFCPMSRNIELADSIGLGDKFVIMYAGNLGYFQGLDVAIRAASKVAHLEDLRLVIMGRGQAEADLRALSAVLGTENVIFLDRVPQADVPRYASLADIQLVSLQDLPFFAATIPGKTQAIMASAQPIIMAVRGDAAAMVEEAGAGLTCAPGSESAMSEAFECAYRMRGPALRAMGSRARAYYERALSFESAARYFDATFEALA